LQARHFHGQVTNLSYNVRGTWHDFRAQRLQKGLIMRLDFTGERVLAVVAHPDDAEYYCAGTLARARSDGAAIGLCVLCRGDKGQPSQRISDLAALRREEMVAAAELLGATLLVGEFGDGELLDRPAERKKVIELFCTFRPTLVLAHSAADYHADHRAAAALADAASWFCTSRGHEAAVPALQTQPALWWMDTMNMMAFEPDVYIDVSEYVDLKRRMLACHKSQLGRETDADFCCITEQMQRQCEVRGAQCGVVAAEAFKIHRAWKRVRAW
jgi:LmbE family N-acetylglucosaminyl deacetylase